MAFAQQADQDSAGLAEVVVTAQRKQERLQDVPISVNSLNQSQLEARGVSDLSINALNLISPAVTGQLLVGRQSYYIRGVGTNQPGNSSESSVATYIDGVYTGNSIASSYTFNNIERIEILKGPQGTLFGRNTTGGVVQIVTTDPSLDHSVLNAKLGYGNYQTINGAFYGSIPISSAFAADFAAVVDDRREGTGYNYTIGKRIYEGWSDGFRSKLLFQPSEDTKFVLSADDESFRNSDGQQRHPNGLCDIFGYCNVQKTGYDNGSGTFPKYWGDGWGVALHASHNFGFATLQNITSYHHDNFHLDIDFDTGPSPFANFAAHNGQNLWTEELRLESPVESRFNWTAGVFFMHRLAFDLPDNAGINGAAIFGPALYNRLELINHTNSYAPFVQATYEVLPKLKLTGGLRFTAEKQDDASTNFTALGPVISPYQTLSYNRLTWRFAADYEFVPDVHGYVSYNRGLKAGGFNQAATPYPPYKPEILDDYEIGLKSELFDRRLRVNLAGYYYNYKDVQETAYPAAGAQEVYNAASATIKGIDGDVDVAVTRNLTLSAGFTALWSKVTSFNGLASTNLEGGGDNVFFNPVGNPLPFASPFVANLTAEYRLPPTPIGDFSGSATFSYNDGYPSDLSTQQYARFPSYKLLNSTISWTSAGDGRYGIDLWAKNLTNAYYFVTLTPIFSGVLEIPADPRTYGVNFKLKF
jgi:iron complex outermembrane receptor protein